MIYLQDEDGQRKEEGICSYSILHTTHTHTYAENERLLESNILDSITLEEALSTELCWSTYLGTYRICVVLYVLQR